MAEDVKRVNEQLFGLRNDGSPSEQGRGIVDFVQSLLPPVKPAGDDSRSGGTSMRVDGNPFANVWYPPTDGPGDPSRHPGKPGHGENETRISKWQDYRDRPRAGMPGPERSKPGQESGATSQSEWFGQQILGQLTGRNESDSGRKTALNWKESAESVASAGDGLIPNMVPRNRGPIVFKSDQVGWNEFATKMKAKVHIGPFGVNQSELDKNLDASDWKAGSR